MFIALFCLVFNELLDAEVRSAFGAPLASSTTPFMSTWSREVINPLTSPTSLNPLEKDVQNGDVKDINSILPDSIASETTIAKALERVSAKLCGQNTSCADSKFESASVVGDKLDERTRLSTTTTPDTLPLTTRRNIYIRGHLLASHRKQTFVPPSAKSDFVHTPDTLSRLHVTHFRNAPAKKASYVAYDKKPSRRKKKHSSLETKRFDNIRFLHETVNQASDNQREQLEVYAWLLGAATLVAVSLTTLAGCFVTCFCSEKLKQYRAKKRQRTRDKGAEYERVESVSSLVDTANDCRDSQCNDWDEPTDNVTVI
ncbi:hypothetical protein LSAT2_006504 [Lamellibrachia satsuma]|nr:hypothetical protein LSAT2_006504 [Lamellibrachia satsuma]